MDTTQFSKFGNLAPVDKARLQLTAGLAAVGGTNNISSTSANHQR